MVKEIFRHFTSPILFKEKHYLKKNKRFIYILLRYNNYNIFEYFPSQTSFSFEQFWIACLSQSFQRINCLIFFLFTYDIRQETTLFKLCETVKLFLQTSLFPVPNLNFNRLVLVLVLVLSIYLSIYLPIYLCIYVRIYLCMYVQYFQYICYDYHNISKNICIKTETVLRKENKNNNLKLSQISINHDRFYFPLSFLSSGIAKTSTSA